MYIRYPFWNKTVGYWPTLLFLSSYEFTRKEWWVGYGGISTKNTPTPDVPIQNNSYSNLLILYEPGLQAIIPVRSRPYGLGVSFTSTDRLRGNCIRTILDNGGSWILDGHTICECRCSIIPLGRVSYRMFYQCLNRLELYCQMWSMGTCKWS